MVFSLFHGYTHNDLNLYFSFRLIFYHLLGQISNFIRRNDLKLISHKLRAHLAMTSLSQFWCPSIFLASNKISSSSTNSKMSEADDAVAVQNQNIRSRRQIGFGSLCHPHLRSLIVSISLLIFHLTGSHFFRKNYLVKYIFLIYQFC